MISFSKKISICLIILFAAISTTGCNKLSNTVVVRTESVYDKVMGASNEPSHPTYANNVVYLGDSAKDSRNYGPRDVSFDFYDLKR